MKNIKSEINKYKKDVKTICDGFDMVENKVGMKSTCCAGCSHCCKQLIEIDSFEYEIIKYHIIGLSNDEKQLLKKVIENQCDILKEQGLIRNVDSLEASDEKKKKKYFKLNMPCPFLLNDKCSIYEIRPETCWTYRQYKNNKYCKKSYQPRHGGLIYFIRKNIFKLDPQDMHFLDKYAEEKERLMNSGKAKFYILQYAILEILS